MWRPCTEDEYLEEALVTREGVSDEDVYWARLKKDYASFIHMKRRTDRDAEGIVALTEDIRDVLASIRGPSADDAAAPAAADGAARAAANEAPPG